MVLRQMSRYEAMRLVYDKELLDCILNKDETALMFCDTIEHKDIDPVLDIELSLYRCEQVGLFDKD